MPRHFVDLDGAAALPTGHFQMTTRIVRDLVANAATGVVHGPAGTGKTFAVEAALEALDTLPPIQRPQVCVLTFPSRPTMRMVADQLLRELTGTETPSSRNRFDLTTKLTGLLATPLRLIVVDEAQRLTGDCIELLRHLHDHPRTRFALLYVGGDGCWEVLSKEPMLRSRVFRRLPFQPLNPQKVPALMRRYHPIYEAAPDDLLFDVDSSYGHGTMRDWAVFTHTAASLCTEQNLTTVDEATVHNAYALLGGGLRD
ncbi:ATP-binding protein (plasmid) [Streptomyces sp. NBC_00853]|uniref:ATP-binding protein n=1 Tax=Streptomyces sp. NBC_00853 TaxID=2903681 RepID=UPI002F907909|nr:ATP-binding protein [Streptomyces sp. NBC_00853]